MSKKKCYQLEELHLSEQTQAFVEYLIQKGMLANPHTSNLQGIQQMSFSQKTFHNTKLLLKNYRDLVWAMETIPEDMVRELNLPLGDLDYLLSRIDLELSMDNKKLESRLRAVHKSRMMIQRLNEGIRALKEKPSDGELIYTVIYRTYIGPKPNSILDLISELGLSNRRYYAYRKKGIDLLALKLWSASTSELDMWMELLTLIEGQK